MAAPASPPPGSPSSPGAPGVPGGPTGAADELPIDVEMIKVLASDSRRDILRLLGERRKTLTELSDALGLKKATVLEHLKKLQDANLIKRLDEDERLWIYYELSPRGKRLVHPERTRFYLIMAGSILAVVTLAAVVVAATMLGAPGLSSPGSDGDARDAGAGAPAVASGMDATVPDVVWRGFDADVPIELETTPPGSLLVIGDVNAPAATIPAADGRAVLDAQAVDALPTGRHALALQTSEGLLALPLQLDVRDPPVAIMPAVVAEGEATRVEVSVGDTSLRRPAVASVRIGEAELAIEARAFTAPALPAGESRVQVGRLATVPLLVTPRVPVTWALDDANLTLTTEPGAQARLDGVELGVTDEKGQLTVPWPAPGEHVLRVVAADGRLQDRAIAATFDSVSPLAPKLSLDAIHGGGAQVLSAHVDVRNDGPANETLTLVARKDGDVVASTAVVAPARGTVTVSLRAEVRTDEPIVIEAFAARAYLSTVSGRASAADSTAGSTAPPMAATPAVTTAPAPSGAPPTSVAPAAPAPTSEDSSTHLWVNGRAPDARATLPAFVAPTAPGEGAFVQYEEPAVPGPSAVLVALAVAIAALALTRRGARRP